MLSYLLPDLIAEKGAKYAYLIQIDDAQGCCKNVYVYGIPDPGPKTHNAHVFFLLGW